MIWHRWEAQARLEDGMCEGRIDASSLQLVTGDAIGGGLVFAPLRGA